jgi:hypothetical protein
LFLSETATFSSGFRRIVVLFVTRYFGGHK